SRTPRVGRSTLRTRAAAPTESPGRQAPVLRRADQRAGSRGTRRLPLDRRERLALRPELAPCQDGHSLTKIPPSVHGSENQENGLGVCDPFLAWSVGGGYSPTEEMHHDRNRPR